MFNRFIERPVLSTVISIIIFMLGLLGLIGLPIEQYPDIAPPTIRVSAFYSGANADAVMNSVIIPLEEKELVDRFGEEYASYKKTVPSQFFPWFRRK